MHQLIVPELGVLDFPPQQTFLTVIPILPLTKKDVNLKLPGLTNAYWLDMSTFARLLRRAGEATLFLDSNQGNFLKYVNNVLLEVFINHLTSKQKVVCLSEDVAKEMLKCYRTQQIEHETFLEEVDLEEERTLEKENDEDLELLC